MKVLFVLFCLLINYSYGQTSAVKTKKTVKWGTIKSSDGSSYVFKNDRKGNQIFSRNVGMNGPITMIYVTDYDSLDREIMSYSVHSNLGFSVYQTEYKQDRIYFYSYSSITEDETSHDQESLKNVKTKSDFLALPVIQNLNNGIRHLTSIEVLNSEGKVIQDIYISEEGDTSSINITDYDSLGRKSVFHYGVDATDSWSWDIYSIYDDSSNIIQSYRISQPNAKADTTEVYNFKFDKTNRLISKDYYYKNKFKNRTDFEFSKKGDRVEYFFEGSEDEVKVKTIYKYDKLDSLTKKIEWDYRNPKGKQKSKTTFTPVYW